MFTKSPSWAGAFHFLHEAYFLIYIKILPCQRVGSHEYISFYEKQYKISQFIKKLEKRCIKFKKQTYYELRVDWDNRTARANGTTFCSVSIAQLLNSYLLSTKTTLPYRETNKLFLNSLKIAKTFENSHET